MIGQGRCGAEIEECIAHGIADASEDGLAAELRGGNGVGRLLPFGAEASVVEQRLRLGGAGGGLEETREQCARFEPAIERTGFLKICGVEHEAERREGLGGSSLGAEGEEALEAGDERQISLNGLQAGVEFGNRRRRVLDGGAQLCVERVGFDLGKLCGQPGALLLEGGDFIDPRPGESLAKGLASMSGKLFQEPGRFATGGGLFAGRDLALERRHLGVGKFIGGARSGCDLLKRLLPI